MNAMTGFTTHFLLTCLFLCACAEQRATDAELRARIDTFVDTVRQCSGVPGLTLAVVKDGQPFHTTGYGVTNTDDNKPVTNQTMFVIASNTKAFVGTLLAKLIDQSPNVTWETPIRDITGDWFYFKDAYRSQHVTLQDTLAHRVGFPGRDTLRAGGFTIRQFMERLRFFDQQYELRTTYSYNNLMYGVAQYVVEVIGGKPWEELTNEHLFQPLGMTSSTFVHKSRDRWAEFATPYMDDGGNLRRVSLEAITTFYSTIGSPGSVSSNSADMAKWLAMHVNDGRNADNEQVVNLTALQRSYTAMNSYSAPSGMFKPLFPATHAYSRYGAGWSLGYFRGYQSIQHTGAALGFYSVSVVVKDQKMAVYMSTNSASALLGIVPVYIMDVIQGVAPWMNETTVCAGVAEKSGVTDDPESDLTSRQLLQDLPEQDDMTPPGGLFTHQFGHEGTARSNKDDQIRKPVIPLQQPEEYVGTYGHYGYGNITVYVNQSTSELMMSYGPVARWVLQQTLEDNVFDGRGQEPLWYWTLFSVTFSGSNETVFNTVDVPFDGADPQRFSRDLKLKTAPPPPELCPQNAK